MPRSFADLKAIRSERRAAALRAQELGQLPRDVHARHGFDPNQPKVLAGFPTDGAWNAPTPPIAPSLSPTFPPASLKHLDSAKYWGAGPSSSGATEQLPVYGFYLSPVPQVPSWAAVLTHPAERASQIMAEPPDPTSWPTPAPPSSSPSGKIPGNLAQPDDTWEGRTSDLLGSALALGAGGGILGNLGPSIGSWNSSDHSWPSSAMPRTANGGIFGGAPLLPAFPQSLSPGRGNIASLSPTPFGENFGSRNVPTLQSDGASNAVYGGPASARRTEPNGIQLAGIDRPFPGIWPPIPPVVVPGLPEWSDHFTRGLQGLINAFRSSGRGRGRRKEDDDEDYCSDRHQAEQRRCYERKHEYAHPDFLDGCLKRAAARWRLCVQNKGRPDPNEPREWGPADEEIGRNFSR